jgi:Cache 3/Cache 2 fusion domain
MSSNKFIACFLTLACFITLIPSLATAQTDKVQPSMAALKAETAKLGAPKVQGSDLFFGTTKVSNDVVDAVVKKQGGVATLFVKSGDQYVRAATTVKKEDGTSAVGTALDPKSPAVAKLNNGEAYYGDATVFGKAYDAGYEPIKDASGAVIGAYFVGYQK